MLLNSCNFKLMQNKLPDSSSLFLDNVNTFFNAIKDKKIQKVSRGTYTLPRLNYKIQGNYVYIENYQSLLNFTNRNIQVLSKYMANKLGCIAQHTSSYFRLKGHLKIDKIRAIEKLYYTKEVLCAFCSSPDTQRKEDIIYCVSCQKERTAING